MEINEIFDTLQDAANRLNDLGVEYMLTGSVAMSSYVPARATMDIDVIIEIDRIDINAFQRRFSDDYYIDSSSIRRAKDRNGIFNAINLNTGIKVDFIARKPNRFEAMKFERRRLADIGAVQFWVISKEDLILSKLAWAKESHSERQFEDVVRLIASDPDLATIKNQIKAQNLDGVWSAYLGWKTRTQK